LKAKLNQAKHGVAVCKAIVSGAVAEANASAADFQAAKTSLLDLKKLVPLSIETAEVEFAHAQALASTADSNEGQKRRQHLRSQKLLLSNAISKEEADQERLDLLAKVYIDAAP